MLDDFASEYKWTTQQVLQHTIYQLREYGKQIAVRKFEERRMALYIQRAAFAADRSEVDRFLESIKPPEEYRLSGPRPAMSIPEGLVHTEE